MPTQGIDRFREGPAVWLEILVDQDDLKPAQILLRDAMGFFPEREVTGGATVDDSPEMMVQVVSCETIQEAHEMKLFLSKRSLQSEIRELREKGEFVAYSVEVIEGDVDRAFVASDLWPERGPDANNN